MKEAKEIFREARERKNCSLKKAAEKTKIPYKYLAAIEAGEYRLFPGFQYAQLYVRDYADFLGLEREKVASVFRRDWQGEGEKGKKGKRGSSLFRNGPLFTGTGLLLILAIAAVSLYLVRQYLVFNSPPSLEVKISCLPGKIVVEGKTDRRAIIRIEGESVGVDDKGEFRDEVSFPWPREVVVEAESPAGKAKEERFPVSCSF